MRAVVQRVSRARVTVNGAAIGEIGAGLMILLGIGRDDSSAIAESMASKIAHLRIFEDDQRKMNCSLLDVNGSALVVSSLHFMVTLAVNVGRVSLLQRRQNRQSCFMKSFAKCFAGWASRLRQACSRQ